MSKFTEALRALGRDNGAVYNAHGFYVDGEPGERVWITYTPGERGRFFREGGAHVNRAVDGRDVKTDPKGHWTQNGRKFFGASTMRHPGLTAPEARRRAIEQAQAWATETYGVGTEGWARDPFGGYGPADFVKARTKILKERVRNAERAATL